MNENSINKLRRKFLAISTLSFTLVMLAMGGLIYFSNLRVLRKEVRETMQDIIENNGDLPYVGASAENGAESVSGGSQTSSVSADRAQNRNDSVHSQSNRPEGLDDSPDIQDVLNILFGRSGQDRNSMDYWYTTRYFSVIFDSAGEVTAVKTSHISAVDEETARQYAEIALTQRFKFGSFGDYYYQVADTQDGGKIVVYVDYADQLRMSRRILYVALILIGAGVIIAFFILRILSFHMVQPEIENAERQKQFITNASHELKTPLAVIRANTEVETMINGENEWNQSTMRQVDRMTGLIQNLVMIARAEEKETGERVDTDVSALLEDTCKTYLPVIQQDGKTLGKKIPERIHMTADESQIRQLATLLLDNAIKYCDDKGAILVSLSQRGKTVTLAISNSYKDGEKVDYSKFFERFYRQDTSHNVDKGGYGIGLSIAESLVKQYRGSISASWKNGMITFTCVLRSA